MPPFRWLALAGALLLTCLIAARAGADAPIVWSVTTNADEVNALAVQGNSLWAATEGGVVRWDIPTRTPTVYTIDHGLPSNQARSIAVDPATGYVWAGTMGGIARWDGGAWRSWNRSSGLLADYVDGVGIDGAGHVWATTSYGASVWDGATWQRYSTMQDAVAARYGDVRAATVPTTIWAVEGGSIVWTTVGEGDGVHRYDGAAWSQYDSGTTPAMPANLIDAVTVTSAGVRWFGTAGGAARWRADGDPQVLGADKLPASRVRAVNSDASGRVWLAAYSCAATCAGGVARVDDRGTADVGDDQWLTLAASAGGLPSSDVRAILSTGDGATWFATANGAARLSSGDTAWTAYTVGALPSNKVTALLRVTLPDNSTTLWAGTDRGLGRRGPDGQWSVFTGQSAARLPSDNVRALLLLGGDVWVGTGENRNGQAVGGLTRLSSAGTWENYGVDGQGTPGNVVGMAAVSQTRLWAATEASGSSPSRLVSQQNGGWLAWVDGQNATLGKVRGVAAYIPPAGGTQVWLATESGVRMLYRYGTSSDIHEDWTTFTNASTGGGLPSDYVTAIGVDAYGSVWVVTPQGVSMRSYAARPTESQRWTTFTPANTGGGLASSVVRAIVVEGWQVWFLHDKGASRYDTYAQQWRTFSRPVDSATMNTLSTARETLCSRWFGTSSGLQYVAFDDCAVVEPTMTPQPSPTLTLTPSPTLTPTLTPSPSPTASPTATTPPTKTPTATRTPTLTLTPTLTPSPSPTGGEGGTPTPTLTPTLTPSPSPTRGEGGTPTPRVYQVFLPYLERQVKLPPVLP
ncbi:MAG: hypothetical protein U0768_08720 [Anaerolineae bacterium]